MYHRYGRHGPHAWLRWYRHRYAHPATSLVPVARSTIVIHSIFNNQERIIFIVVLSADENSNFTEPRFIPQRSSSNSLLEERRNDILGDGYRRAIKDEDGEGIPLQSDLHKDAKKAGLDFIDKNPDITKIPGVSMPEIISYYVGVFIEGYLSYFDVRPENAEQFFHEQSTRATRQRARSDKSEDLQNNIILTEPQIRYQAAIRAVQQLHLEPRSGTAYLQQVQRYIPVYERFYLEGEVNRNYGDRSF